MKYLINRLREFHLSQFKINQSANKLIKTSLSRNTLILNSNFYCMTDGLSMDSPFKPIFSDIHMHYLELNLLNNLDFPFCYVYDCFSLLNSSELDLANIFSVTNFSDEHVQFTYEKVLPACTGKVM